MRAFWPFVSASASTRPDPHRGELTSPWQGLFTALQTAIAADPLPTTFAAPASRRQSPHRRSTSARIRSVPSRQLRQPQVADAVTLAAELQLQAERRERFCSALALSLKLGLVALGGVSLVKLAFAYQERLDRHGELAAVVDVETGKLKRLQHRFDRLFTLGGDRRLMGEQDQWIAPNRLRVIWR